MLTDLIYTWIFFAFGYAEIRSVPAHEYKSRAGFMTLAFGIFILVCGIVAAYRDVAGFVVDSTLVGIFVILMALFIIDMLTRSINSYEVLRMSVVKEKKDVIVVWLALAVIFAVYGFHYR